MNRTIKNITLLPSLLLLVSMSSVGIQFSNAATNQTLINSTRAPVQENETSSSTNTPSNETEQSSTLSSSLTSTTTNQTQNRIQQSASKSNQTSNAITNIAAQLSKLPENTSKSEIAKLQRQLIASSIYGPAILNQPYRVTVTFDSITVHNDHDHCSYLRSPFGGCSGSGEWNLFAYVQGQQIDLKRESSNRLSDVDGGDTVNFKPTAQVTLDIPKTHPLSIFTVGYEDDPPIFGACLESPPYDPAILQIFEDPPSTWFDAIHSYQIDHTGPPCGPGWGDSIGIINKIYDPPAYGEGAHTNVVSSIGDFTLRYTISVQPPPTVGGVEPGDKCNDKLGVSGISSSASQSGHPRTNAIDSDLSTYWLSRIRHNPFIILDLGAQRPLCLISIAWHDGNLHPYKFNVTISKDGTSYANAFSGTSSGTTTSPETYGLNGLEGRYVKIIVTQSTAGSPLSTAHISEIEVFGKFTGNEPGGPTGGGVIQ